MIQKTLIASAISLVMLSGCSDNNPTTGSTEGIDGSGNNASNSGESNITGADNTNGSNVNSEPTADTQDTKPALQQLDDSEAFYAALREGIIQQNILLEGGEDSVGGATAGDGIGAEAPAEVSIAEVGTADTNSPTPVTDSDESDATDGDVVPTSATNLASSGDFATATGTNVQEVGVDEQDRIKSDGEFLYILENQYGDSYFADFDLQGRPQNINKIRILALKNEVPDAEPVTDLQLDLNGGVADGMYLLKDNTQRHLILTSTLFDEFLYEAEPEEFAYNSASFLVSKLDVTNPANASDPQSVKIEGRIVSSRRIDDKLFVASRYQPAVPNVDPYSMSPEEYQAAIEAADLTQTLPKVTNIDGTTNDLVDPAECFVAPRGQGEGFYYTPEIVSLAVIDLKTLQLDDSECFLGSTEALYATSNSVYLATTRWEIGTQETAEESEFERADTDIHQFAINGAELTYSGSGVVSGYLGWNSRRNSSRMSEKGDYLRVATFSEFQNDSVSSIMLSVLNVAGDGELVKVSELPNANNPEPIGKPGARLHASRFIGDRAYLVTSGQNNPLYVVDISDPSTPKIAGELEIDGYSDYLQPIGENHLLGIGHDTVPGPVEWGEGALQQGIKLSLFNIADANNPTEVQSVVVGERGTEADALRNHRAITIQPATDSHPARVAFGISVHGLANPRPDSSNPYVRFPWNFSGLHGFDINVGSGAGIEPRGAMVVNTASNPRLAAFGYGGDDRSVIVGDAVYYIRSSEVFAAYWSDLGNFNGPR